MKFKPYHVALTVRNTAESIQWYENKLDFKVTHRYDKNGSEITQMARDEVGLELFCYGEATKPLPDYRHQLEDDLHVIGTKHLCIEVENLEETVADLKSRGVNFVMDIDTASFGGRYIFFKDCNDILIELYQR